MQLTLRLPAPPFRTSNAAAPNWQVNFDDNAAYRQKDIHAKRDTSQENPIEVEAKKYDLNYIKLALWTKGRFEDRRLVPWFPWPCHISPTESQEDVQAAWVWKSLGVYGSIMQHRM